MKQCVPAVRENWSGAVWAVGVDLAPERQQGGGERWGAVVRPRGEVKLLHNPAGRILEHKTRLNAVTHSQVERSVR